MKPRVLIATTAQWFPTARLAMALSRAGFSVDAVCPPRHPLQKISSIRKTYIYDGFAAPASFGAAVTTSRPDLIVPGDEYAVRCFHKLYEQARRRAGSGTALCTLIERSLGPAESFYVLAARAAMMQLAQEESIRVPRTMVVRDLADLTKKCEGFVFPVVLKADGSSSGEGVRIVRNVEEAKSAFRTLQSPPSAIRMAKRALIDRDMRLVWPTLLRKQSQVNIQEFISGQDATSLVTCWNGAVLASLHFEVIQKQYKNGPASVMRRIELPELDLAISKVVRRLQLSGFHGFDFLLQKQTGNPFLIEVNPRPTQIGHLALGAGRDLPAALFAAVTGTMIEESPKITDNDTIALFPQEWKRNPQSVFLHSGYHDIPWEEPELIRAGTRPSRNWASWYNRRKWAPFLVPHRVPRANE